MVSKKSSSSKAEARVAPAGDEAADDVVTSGLEAPAEAAPHDTAPLVDANGKPAMHVKVYSPRATYFDALASSLSAASATGPFDILPHHHNFITLLEPCELEIRQTGRDLQRIKISGGLLHVKADRATVFLDV